MVHRAMGNGSTHLVLVRPSRHRANHSRSTTPGSSVPRRSVALSPSLQSALRIHATRFGPLSPVAAVARPPLPVLRQHAGVECCFLRSLPAAMRSRCRLGGSAASRGPWIPADRAEQPELHSSLCTRRERQSRALSIPQRKRHEPFEAIPVHPGDDCPCCSRVSRGTICRPTTSSTSGSGKTRRMEMQLRCSCCC